MKEAVVCLVGDVSYVTLSDQGVLSTQRPGHCTGLWVWCNDASMEDDSLESL